MGVRGSKKAYAGPRTGIYLPTKFGCDQSIVVGCRSRNDRPTDKQNGMTIRLILCDVNVTQYFLILIGYITVNKVFRNGTSASQDNDYTYW